MRIARYGVVLNRLKRDKIELLRKWRNAPRVSDYMEFRDYITPEMQKRWFEQVNNTETHYFLVEYQALDIGMIHCSGIDWSKRTGHSGLFIHDERFYSTPVPVFASLALLDTFFFLFGLEEIDAKVKADNERAVSYNQNLGFSRAGGEEGKTFQRFRLTKEEYLAKARQLRDYARRINGDGTELTLEPSHAPVDRDIWKIIEHAPEEARNELNLQVLPG